MFQTAFLSEITDLSKTVPAGTRAYLQERLRNRLYDLVLTEFMKRQEEDPEFTQAALAKRIEKRPEQINRWLSSPGNWTIDTISDLLVGIMGAELEIGTNHFVDQMPRNYAEPEWLNQEASKDGIVLIVQLSSPKRYEVPPTDPRTVTIGDL
jgi:hypothetical protein